MTRKEIMPHQKIESQRGLVHNHRQAFDQAFQEINQKGNRSTISIWVFIGNTLRQKKLSGLYTEQAILNEVYIRGISAIESGHTINNPFGWARTTSFNYIRELQRKHRKHLSFQEDLDSLSTYSDQDDDDKSGYDEHCQLKIQTALEQLSPLDQEVLRLKVVERLSWQEIRESLVQSGFGHYELSSLRKRKSRALKLLRNKCEGVR